jgi:protein-tyrosine kinase
MPSSIGLIERAAALLREREGTRAEEAPSPSSEPVSPEIRGGRQLVLDTARLARYGIALPSDERSRTVEEFRLIKRNLMRLWSQDSVSAEQPPARLIMVASARPGEGKTFVAVNLALAFASEADVDALLIDVDTEHPLTQTILGMSAEAGIVDVLAGRASLSDVLLPTSLPKLTILPAGAGGPDVPELFSSKRMAELIAEVLQRYRNSFIVIDSPPCLASSDAIALAPLVGQIVFVIEAHRTRQQEIDSSLNLLKGCPRISLLLNKSDQTTTNHFGSYGYYYYTDRSGDARRPYKRK